MNGPILKNSNWIIHLSFQRPLIQELIIIAPDEYLNLNSLSIYECGLLNCSEIIDFSHRYPHIAVYMDNNCAESETEESVTVKTTSDIATSSYTEMTDNASLITSTLETTSPNILPISLSIVTITILLLVAFVSLFCMKRHKKVERNNEDTIFDVLLYCANENYYIESQV